MKNLQVSTDVFAAIWSHREPGEETEDQILKRILIHRGEFMPDKLTPKEKFDRTGMCFNRDNSPLVSTKYGVRSKHLYESTLEILKAEGPQSPRSLTRHLKSYFDIEIEPRLVVGYLNGYPYKAEREQGEESNLVFVAKDGKIKNRNDRLKTHLIKLKEKPDANNQTV